MERKPPPIGYDHIDTLFHNAVRRICAGATRRKLRAFEQYCAARIATRADVTVRYGDGTDRDVDSGEYWAGRADISRHPLHTGFYKYVPRFPHLARRCCYARQEDIERLANEFRDQWVNKRIALKKGRGHPEYPFKDEVLCEFSLSFCERNLTKKEITAALQDWARANFPEIDPPTISAIRDWIGRPFRKRHAGATVSPSMRRSIPR